MAAVTTKNRWIISPGVDLCLYLFFPVVLAAAAFGAEAAGWLGIFLVVVAITANGHHLPTFLRIYGDPVLLRRFPGRFLVIPVLVVGGFAYCTYYNLAAMKVLLLFWGHWHGFIQLYGFTRIYDAKQGSVHPTTANLDWLVIFLGFLGGVLFSELRMLEILDGVASVGIPLIPLVSVSFLQSLWFVVVGGLAVLYGFQIWRCRRQGRPQSPIKWLFIASSIGFWWFCNLYIANIILAMALIEIYHDLQYIGFVWEYNTHYVQKKAQDLYHWQRQLFRRHWAMLGVYGLVVIGYGFFGEVTKWLRSPAVTLGFEILIGTSTLCHFYFDGFIWKLKDSKVRHGFNVASHTKGSSRHLIRGVGHNPLLVGVAGLLVYFVWAQPLVTKPPLQHMGEVAQILDTGPESHLRYGVALAENGFTKAADEVFAYVQQLKPGYRDVRVQRALNLITLNQLGAAEALLLQETQARPDFYEARRELAITYLQARKLDKAATTLRELQQQHPRDPVIHFHQGLLSLYRNAPEDAAAHFRDTLSLDPEFQPARAELAALGYPSGL